MRFASAAMDIVNACRAVVKPQEKLEEYAKITGGRVSDDEAIEAKNEQRKFKIF